MMTKPREYWQKKLDEVGVPNGPLNTVPEVLELAQTEELGIMYQPYANSDGQFHGLPVSFDGQRAGNNSKAPKLNE